VRKVQQALRRFRVSGGMVVAVSGGPDSVALLRAMHEARGSERLSGAHLNHQLRGAESDADEAFVRDLCAELSVEYSCHRLDVRNAAGAEGANLEAVARRLRYDWLGHAAEEVGARWVATGHTADDQAETVLHRLLRGAGLRGLRGIAAQRDLAAGLTLVRPLLTATRAEVMVYLQEIGQGYREDRSNLDPAFTRNRIRHDLLPLLTGQYNPEITACLGRLAEQAEAVFADEEQRALVLLQEAELPRAGAVLVFDQRRLVAAPRHLLREAFRLVWQRERWPMDPMGFDAWERVAASALGEAGAADLPGGVRIGRRAGVVQLARLTAR
jgi:tRNA(Ile)-lysidine synthase